MSAPLECQRAWFQDIATGSIIEVEVACVGRISWLGVCELLPDKNTRPLIRVPQPQDAKP